MTSLKMVASEFCSAFVIGSFILMNKQKVDSPFNGFYQRQFPVAIRHTRIRIAQPNVLRQNEIRSHEKKNPQETITN